MRSARRLQQSSRVLKHGDDLVAALEMKVPLVTLTTKFEEQQKIIASQSDILREINSKLTGTVAESHDSSSDSGIEETKAPDSDLSCTHCS